MSVSAVADKLLKEGFDRDVCDVFRRNKVSLCILLELDVEDFKELGIDALGDRKRLKSLIARLKIDPSEINESEIQAAGSQSTSTQQIQMEDSCWMDGYQSDKEDPPNDDLAGSTNSSCIEPSASNSDDLGSGSSCSSNSDDNMPSAQIKFPTKILQTVPSRLAGWEDEFVVPTQFSEKTMASLSVAKLDKAARTEITQAVVCNILTKCKYPTSKQVAVVAAKVVEKIPGSKDFLGIGHESWIRSIENRLINVRRRPVAGFASSEGKQPRDKKRKLSHPTCTAIEAHEVLSETTYNRLQKSLVMEWKRTRRNASNIRSVFEELRCNRRLYIAEERPSVLEVIEKFPPLIDLDYLMMDFCNVIAQTIEEKTVADNWATWAEKVMSYVQISRKSTAKSVIDMSSSDNNEVKVLKLISCLLEVRKKDPFKYIISTLPDAADIDEHIDKIIIATPYMVECNVNQYFIIAERRIYHEVKTFPQALMSLIAIYYVYDISYPKECSSTLLAIEKIVFGISTGPEVKKSALATLTDINNQ